MALRYHFAPGFPLLPAQMLDVMQVIELVVVLFGVSSFVVDVLLMCLILLSWLLSVFYGDIGDL